MTQSQVITSEKKTEICDGYNVFQMQSIPPKKNLRKSEIIIILDLNIIFTVVQY